jgi:putative ABC transport system permease protein
MDALLRDLRFGVRMLLKRPVLSLAAIVTFGLGIGLTTAVFSIVDGIFLRGLPFEGSERVMAIQVADPALGYSRMGVEVADLVDLGAQQTVFEGLGAYTTHNINFAPGNGEPELLHAGSFSAGVLRQLHVRPVLGRGFREAEERPGADPTVIIGYDLWQERFGGSRDVLGRTVRIDGVTRTIVGVMPAGFGFPAHEALWLPLRLDPSASPRGRGASYDVIGRLKEGVSLPQAQAQLATLVARIESQYPDSHRGLRFAAVPYIEFVTGRAAPFFLTMFGAVVGVLLIACANVANLLLARSSVRTREIAVRTALGASRGRVVAQLMVEVVVLAGAGAVLGLVLATAGIAWFNSLFANEPKPFWMVFDLNPAVLLFALGATVISGAASSLVPALKMSKTDVAGALKDEGRGLSSRRMGRFSSALIVAEMAVSCALLVASGLMVRSIAQLAAAPMPFATTSVLTAQVRLPARGYADAVSRIAFYDQLLPRLSAIPGVAAATLSDGLPATENDVTPFRLEGRAYASVDEVPRARRAVVEPGYFGTFQVGVLRGRGFGGEDRRGALPVAVVNASFVRRHFPDGDPIGRRFREGARDSTRQWLTVVGVVPDLHMQGMGNNERGTLDEAGFYVPLAQSDLRYSANVILRVRGDPMDRTSDVRAAVASLDPDLPIYRVLSMGAVIGRETWFFRSFGGMFVVFGLAALFLAAVGLYGVMSFSVTARTHEMGVRSALGAPGGRLVWLVLRKSVGQLAIGLVIGLALAALAAGPLEIILYDVDARDPVVFGGVAATLALVGFAAAFIPARRAARVHPAEALNAE